MGARVSSIVRSDGCSTPVLELPPTPVRHAAGRVQTADARRIRSVIDWDALEPRGVYPRFGKPALRIVLLVLCLVPSLALGLVIALANAVLFRSVRRVLYTQPRVGRRGEVFSIYKFRTMRECQSGDFESWSRGEDVLRVTRFGRLLRNTHLDELPQVLNILRGEMDFIGPRPEMLEISAWACASLPRFQERHALLPGVTGLAQVTQGYVAKDVRAYARKLAADQHYRRKLSLALDLEILVRTALWMVRARGWRRAPRQRAAQVSESPTA